MRNLVCHEIILTDTTEYAKKISALSVGARYGLAPEEIEERRLVTNQER